MKETTYAPIDRESGSSEKLVFSGFRQDMWCVG